MWVLGFLGIPGQKLKELEENSEFSGGNGGGLVLMVDRGFSEKWEILDRKEGEKTGKRGEKSGEKREKVWFSKQVSKNGQKRVHRSS